MSGMLGEIKHLFLKDLVLELKLKHTLGSIVLFAGSTIFICYLSFLNIVDQFTWNALFWIIILFASTSSMSRSFQQEGENRFLYYYFLVKPQSIIIAKSLYNILVTLFIATFSLGLYLVIMGDPVGNLYLFTLTVFLGVVGLAIPLTMIAAIAAKAGNNPVMMSILSFPVVIPVILQCIKMSKVAIDDLDPSLSIDEIIVLIALDVIVFVLSVLLFPYLWKS